MSPSSIRSTLRQRSQRTRMNWDRIPRQRSSPTASGSPPKGATERGSHLSAGPSEDRRPLRRREGNEVRRKGDDGDTRTDLHALASPSLFVSGWFGGRMTH